MCCILSPLSLKPIIVKALCLSRPGPWGSNGTHKVCSLPGCHRYQLLLLAWALLTGMDWESVEFTGSPYWETNLKSESWWTLSLSLLIITLMRYSHLRSFPLLDQRRNSHGQSNRLTNKLSQTNYQTKEPQTTALNVDEKTRNIFGVSM